MGLITKRCLKCMYITPFTGVPYGRACGYTIFEGVSRGCEAGAKCTKYKKATPEERRRMRQEKIGFVSKEYIERIED